MSHQHKWVVDHVKMIEAEGGVVLDLKVAAHNKLVVRTPYGEKTLLISKTPSDHRAFSNNRALVRRWMKGAT